MKKVLLNVVFLALACFLFSGVAKADDIHLCNVSSGCNAASLQSFSGTTAFVTGNPTGDSLFLVALTPQAGTGGAFNASTDLWTAAGLSGPNQPNFAALVSADAGFAGFTPGSFNFSITSLGTWTVNGQQITIPGGPIGTVFLVFTKDAQGHVALLSPFSSDLALVGAPEPSSVMLFGAGLLGLLILAGKKRQTA